MRCWPRDMARAMKSLVALAALAAAMAAARAGLSFLSGPPPVVEGDWLGIERDK